VWIHANKFSRSSLVFKLHDAVNQSKQCIVLAATNVGTWFPFGSALTRENVAAENTLTAKLFQTQTLRVRISTVARRTYTLFMSHFLIFDLRLLICDFPIVPNGFNRKSKI